jgi:SAM-dependent methyltransferase
VARFTDRLNSAIVGVARRVRPGAFGALRRRARGATALELGGPSGVFRPWRLWALYDRLAYVDLANYAELTLWDTASATGTLPGGARVRRRLVSEAGRLHDVPDGVYDLVLASHVLEHVANPLAALAEWRRVLRPDGRLVLVLPHRDATFDHRRPVTPLAHLLDDLASGVDEDDTTHVEEVLALHDLARDPDAGGAERFAARLRENARWRAMHHHVFDTQAALAMVDAAGWSICQVDVQRPHHILIVADPRPGANAAWLAPSAPWRRSSPFPSDRRA